MKIKVSENQREQLQDLRDAIADLRKEIVGSNSKRSKLEARQTELEEVISGLEKADPGNRKARAELGDARTELEMTENRLRELPIHDMSPAQESAAGSLLRDLQRLIDAIMRPYLEERLAACIKQMRPLFNSDERARSAAWDCDANASLGVYVGRGFGSSGRHHLGWMASAVKLADEFLAGELNFEFNSNVK